MTIAGKKSVHFTKKGTQDQRVPAIGFKKIRFAHEPTEGDTEIDLTSLVLPGSGLPASFVNPSAADLAAAKLLFNEKNLILISSYKGLLSFDDYEIKDNTTIVLKDPTSATEIFMGIIDPIAKTGLQVVDVDPIVVTGTLAAGADEFIVGKPFNLNAYPTQQQGEILVFLDGQLMARNVGNEQSASGDGDYYEVDLGTTQVGNSIKFNQTSASDRSVMVVSNGLAFAAPNDSLRAAIETLNTQIDLMVPTLAALAGVAESTFQGAPNNVDLALFGNRMTAAEAAIDAQEVLNPARGQLLGTDTDDSAPAGYVGEMISSTVSGVAWPTSNEYGDATSILLTPGQWEVYGVVAFEGTASANYSYFIGAIDTQPGNTLSSQVQSQYHYFEGSKASGERYRTANMRVILKLNTPTTVYLKHRVIYSVAGTSRGTITATRVR